jgi:hypothetical protein
MQRDLKSLQLFDYWELNSRRSFEHRKRKFAGLELNLNALTPFAHSKPVLCLLPGAFVHTPNIAHLFARFYYSSNFCPGFSQKISRPFFVMDM